MNNDDVALDDMFKASLIFDIIRGIIYLHDSLIGYHGNLKVTNCLVDSRWVLKLSDFGLQVFRSEWPNVSDILSEDIIDEALCESLLYRAPELLTAETITGFHVAGLQKADAYSFAIILHELHLQQGPFGYPSLLPSEVLKKVLFQDTKEPFRPDMSNWTEYRNDYIDILLFEAWSENPYLRPDFKVWHIHNLLFNPLFENSTLQQRI